jgi:hypothetical protein
MTRIYLPLRSSVEFFQDSTSPEPVTRAKQAAILYDEVVFEDGLLDASLTESGSFINYMPRGMFNEADLTAARTIYPPGSGFRVEMQLNPGSTDPEQPELVLPALEGTFTAKYAAEWYTGVIEELQHVKPPWAKAFQMNDEQLGNSGLVPVTQEIRAMIGDVDLGEIDLIRREYLIQSFCRDAAVAAQLDAAVNVTSLFEPLVTAASGIGLQQDPAGTVALEVVTPNVSASSWEQISEFRDHHGSAEAREKLREIERCALADDPGDVLSFQTRVAQEVTDLLFGVIQDLSGSPGRRVAREAANTGISFIPLVGPILGPGASMAETGYEIVQNRRSWYAALMKLRAPAA